VQPPEAGGFFFIFKALKWLKFDTKYLENAKINNANLYYNFSPRFLKIYFSTGEACAPSSPPIESPMTKGNRKIKILAMQKKKTS